MSDTGGPEDPEVARLREQLAAAERVAELRAKLDAAQSDLNLIEREIASITDHSDDLKRLGEKLRAEQKSDEDPQQNQGENQPLQQRRHGSFRDQIRSHQKEIERARSFELAKLKAEQEKRAQQLAVFQQEREERQQEREERLRRRSARQEEMQERATEFFRRPIGRLIALVLVLLIGASIFLIAKGTGTGSYESEDSALSAPFKRTLLSTSGVLEIDCSLAGTLEVRDSSLVFNKPIVVNWHPDLNYQGMSLELKFGDGAQRIWSSYEDLADSIGLNGSSVVVEHSYWTTGEFTLEAELFTDVNEGWVKRSCDFEWDRAGKIITKQGLVSG